MEYVGLTKNSVHLHRDEEMVCDTEEWATVSGFGTTTANSCLDQVVVGFGLFMWLVMNVRRMSQDIIGSRNESSDSSVDVTKRGK